MLLAIAEVDIRSKLMHIITRQQLLVLAILFFFVLFVSGCFILIAFQKVVIS